MKFIGIYPVFDRRFPGAFSAESGAVLLAVNVRLEELAAARGIRTLESFHAYAHVDLPPDDESARQLGEQLVTRGLVPEGADVVFVSINPDLSRREANFLKIHRI